MQKGELLALAQALALRCEQAQGADRELDCHIAAFAGYRNKFTGEPLVEALDNLNFEDAMRWDFPYYTASIDAAMSLVPEQCRLLTLNEQDFDEERPWVVRLTQRNAAFGRAKVFDAIAATPALALTAAALRARAALVEGVEGK